MRWQKHLVVKHNVPAIPGQLHRPAVSAGQSGLQAERQAPHGTPGAGDSGRQAGGESAPERAGEPAHPPCGWGIRCGRTHPGQRHVFSPSGAQRVWLCKGGGGLRHQCARRFCGGGQPVQGVAAVGHRCGRRCHGRQ